MDPHDVLLRRAEPEDAEAIADLYGAARVAAEPMMPPAMHTSAEDRAWFAARLAADSHEAWVAEQEGELLGYALFTERWLDHLFLRPDVTGQGIGTVLLDLVKSLRPDGFCLWVFESNTRRPPLLRAATAWSSSSAPTARATRSRSPDVKMAWPGADPLDVLPRPDRRRRRAAGRPAGPAGGAHPRRAGPQGRHRPRPGARAGDRRGDGADGRRRSARSGWRGSWTRSSPRASTRLTVRTPRSRSSR